MQRFVVTVEMTTKISGQLSEEGVAQLVADALAGGLDGLLAVGTVEARECAETTGKQGN